MFTSWKPYVIQLLLTLFIAGACSRMAETADKSVLVSTEWLQENLNDPDLVILHAGSAESYDSIHIPGARLAVPADFTETTAEMRNEMPPADSLVALLRKLGVNQESRIVLYAQRAGLTARTARIFLALEHLGLGGRVHVLNGGLLSWQEEGRTLTHLVPDIRPGNMNLEELKQVIIQSGELDSWRWSEEVVLLDNRSDEEYHGTPAMEDHPAEGGHIEGAYFLPYQDLLMDESPHMFKPDSELEDLFVRIGMDRKKKTVVYCGSGIRASVGYLAARHLGYPTLLYDGSYEEWSSLGLPLTGPAPLNGINE